MYLNRIITYLFLFLIGIGGFFGNIHINIQNQDNQINTIVSYETNTTYAADPEKDASKKAMEMYNEWIDGINAVLAILSIIISPIILFVGWLMSPDWTSGDLFNLREPMYKLWITISNIVYFIYAILLIFIALWTMFNQEKFGYKVMLPKLALGILMVPVTWWFVQWTISIASVVTASVMTIPTETITGNDSAWFQKASIPTVIVMDSTGSGSISSSSIDCEITPGACISPKQFLEKAWGMFSPMIIYGYSVFKFQKIDRLDWGLDVAKAALKIVHSSVVAAIMFLVFWLLTLALAAMLFVRAIKLWMYAIFSPLFTFRFVAGSNLLWGDDDSFSLKEFIGLAFVPAIVGITLSFGLIIINAVNWPERKPGATPPATTCNLRSSPGCVTSGILWSPENEVSRQILKDSDGVEYTDTRLKFGGIQAIFLWKAVNQSDGSWSAIGPLDAAGGMFGTLIIDIIALVFIWMAFMAAKNVSKAVKGAVEPFEAIGKSVGDMAKSLPKYTPIPGTGISASTIWKTAELSRQKLDSTMRTRDEEKVGSLFPNLVEWNIKELDRVKAQEKLKWQIKDYKWIQSTLWDLNSGMKFTEANIKASQLAIQNAGVDVGRLVQDITNDRSISDEKLRAAAIKFAKWENIDKQETELVIKWLQSKAGTWKSKDTNNPSDISAKVEISKDGTNKITILNEPLQFKLKNNGDIDGNITGVEALKWKNMNQSKEDFEKSLQNSWNLTKSAAATIVSAIEKQGWIFNSKIDTSTPPASGWSGWWH